MENETGWISEARKGSPAAFAELVRLHQSAVRAYLGRFVRDRETADDLAQDAFLAAYRTLDTWRGESSFRIWLIGIARNRALSHLRDEQVRRASLSDALRALIARVTLRRLEVEDVERMHDRLDSLRRCMGGLAPASSSILRDFYFKGRTAVEIARMDGRSEGAVWMSLLRIRQTLRDCMEGRP